MTSRLDEEKKAFIISGSVTFCIIGRNEDGTPFILKTIRLLSMRYPFRRMSMVRYPYPLTCA